MAGQLFAKDIKHVTCVPITTNGEMLPAWVEGDKYGRN